MIIGKQLISTLKNGIASNIYVFAIIIIALVAYWNIASCNYFLKYDIIDANFPNQVFQSQLEQQGEIPLWDMFSYFGNAFHSKMLMYYPVRFISSQISEYTLYKFNIEFVLHIILAGIGMYLLLLRFSCVSSIAFIIAVAYMLSGFFTGNAQHFWWVVSGAFLPFIILTYYNLLQTPGFKQSLYFIFVFVCFVLGGYPAFTIVVGYALCIYFVYTIVFNAWNAHYMIIRAIIVQHIIIAIVCIILLLPVIVSYSDMIHAISRGNGVTLAQALWDSLHPKHCITFIFPLLTAYTKNNFWHIDPSMMNMYIGLLPFIMALFSVLYSKKTHILFIWIVVLLSIAMSFGTVLPLREFFYTYVPLFNVFRFPALFRLFTMFGLLVLAAYSFHYFKDYIHSKNFSYFLIITAAITGIIALLYFVIPLVSHQIPYSQWYVLIELLNKKQLIGVQSLMLSVIAIFVFILHVLVFSKKGYSPYVGISLFVSLDMIVSVLLLSPVTIHNHIQITHIQHDLNKLPKQTAIRNIFEQAYSQYSKELALPAPLWRNNQLLYKKRTYDGYTSFVYNKTNDFEKSVVYDSIKTYPLLYIPQCIYTTNDTVFDFTKKIVILETQPILYKSIHTKLDSIEFVKSTARSVTCKIQSSQEQYLVFMQNMYPGWKAYINNTETAIQLANYCCMAITIPQGKVEVTFTYEPKYAIVGYYIYTYALYILIAACIISIVYSKRR